MTDWISQHPDWALALVFAIAFIESIAVIGLLMPGWLLLVGVGVLIGTGNINFYLASLFCFAGAIMGEYLSFIIGVHYQHRVHHWSIFKRHPNWLANTELFFQRYGVASIALGRFVGPVRAFVPLLAGMSAMPTLQFQVTNILSAMIWAPIYLIPGIILGASVQIDSAVRWIILGNIVVVVISAWVMLTYLINVWRRMGVVHQDSNFDNKMFLLKALSAALIMILALINLMIGEQHQQLIELIQLVWKIINQ